MTFDSFISQYNSTGREKLDGYSPSDFEGMTEDELKEAESLLIRSAERLDTTAFQGLAILKSSAGRKILENIISRLIPPSLAHLHAAEALYDITNDSSLQIEICKNLDERDEFLFGLTVTILAHTSITPFLYRTMRQLAAETSVHYRSTVHSEACDVLVRSLGFPSLIKDQSQERLALERKLYFSDTNGIESVLDEFKVLGKRRGYIPVFDE